MFVELDLRKSVNMNKVKLVRASADEILLALYGWRKLENVTVVEGGTQIPEDCLVVAVNYNQHFRGWDMLVYHPSFPELPSNVSPSYIDEKIRLKRLKVRVMEDEISLLPLAEETVVDYPGLPATDVIKMEQTRKPQNPVLEPISEDVEQMLKERHQERPGIK